MSCNMYVYVGAAAKIEVEPENAKSLIEDLTEETFMTAYNGQEERLPYLLPNFRESRYGVTFDRHDNEPHPINLSQSQELADAVTRFYDDHRESLFALSSAGFTLTVQYVALSYWY